MAPDAEQDRYLMSHTSRERRHVPVPMRRPYASAPSRPGHRIRRAVRSLIRPERLPRCPLYTSNLTSVQTCWLHSVGVTSTLELGAAIKSP